MKFKSNVKVTQEAPVNFEDLMQDMDNVLNMELEEAVEHLEDLTILEQNISKYGVTEPVMHLVGGTLESMSISIADKESCLEGLKEGLKEAGKKVWEVIVKIYEKIRDYIKGILDRYNKKRIDALKAKVKGMELDADIDVTGLIPAKYIKSILFFKNLTFVKSDDTRKLSISEKFKGMSSFLTLAGSNVEEPEVSVKQKFIDECNDPRLSSKGYTSVDQLMDSVDQLSEAYVSLYDFVEESFKEANRLRLTSDGKIDKLKAEAMRVNARVINAVLPYIRKSIGVTVEYFEELDSLREEK